MNSPHSRLSTAALCLSFLLVMGILGLNRSYAQAPGDCEICDLIGLCQPVEGSSVAGTDECIQYWGPQSCSDAGETCNA